MILSTPCPKEPQARASRGSVSLSMALLMIFCILIGTGAPRRSLQEVERLSQETQSEELHISGLNEQARIRRTRSLNHTKKYPAFVTKSSTCSHQFPLAAAAGWLRVDLQAPLLC
jgi:hypothetical protein